MTAANPNPPDDIPPGPVPTAFAVASVANGAGDSLVLLRVSTAQGVQFFFIEPTIAVQVGNALRAEGKRHMGPTLSVPPSGLVVPGLRPA